MDRRFWTTLALVLLIVIVVLALVLVFVPSPAKAPASPLSSATSTAGAATASAPLDTQVSVTYPQPGSPVASTFTVTGVAPAGWYFEAVFPVQVRDPDDNLLATGQGQAETDWTTPGLVPFSSTDLVVSDYSGPATLILNKDNPSGLPENDDSVTIPIMIR